MARKSLCENSYLFSASLSKRDQYSMGRVVSPSFFRSNTHPTCLSHASVFILMCLVELVKASTGGETRASFNASIAASSFSLSGTNFVNRFFCIFLFNGALVVQSVGLIAGTPSVGPRRFYVLKLWFVLEVRLIRQFCVMRFRDVLGVLYVPDSRWFQ